MLIMEQWGTQNAIAHYQGKSTMFSMQVRMDVR